MTSRRSLAAGAATALLTTLFTGLLTGSLVVPAQAEDTAVTFTLTGGGLGITPQPTATLGGALVDESSMSGRLGPVTVTDARGQLAAAWIASVSSTVFTTGDATSPETVGKARLTYQPGDPTVSTPGTFTPRTGTLDASLAAYTAVATGINSVTWNPVLTIDLSTAGVAGIYSGTVTHSVS